MEALFSHLSALSADDGDFDPSRIDYQFELFEREALASCDAEILKAVDESEAAMEKTENYLKSILDAAADEFLQSSAEADQWMSSCQKNMEMAFVPAMGTMKAAFTNSKIQPF